MEQDQRGSLRLVQGGECYGWSFTFHPIHRGKERHGVLASICSHILAFDVQVHEGVLQLLTAGAGTAHRMPEGIEYLHCVQVSLDAKETVYVGKNSPCRAMHPRLVEQRLFDFTNA